ncbi:MAG: MASE1 domain-containing protein [Candidatus Lambdaproteobacteria bacterium]|nr:MASE1 domain-containing protein [Candidatus Lambdaproteobacteria bacterium]
MRSTASAPGQIPPPVAAAAAEPRIATPLRSVHAGWGAVGRDAARFVLLAAAYFVAARIGLHYGMSHGNISPVWPASGVAIAGVLAWGLRMAPAVALGNGLAVMVTEASLFATLSSAVAATVETVLAGLLLRWIVGKRLPFYRVIDLVHWVLWAGIAATAVGAAVGVSGMTAGGIGLGEAFNRLWVGWWLGDMMGVLWVAPVFLTVPADWRRADLSRPALFQAGLIAALIVALGLIVFGEPWPELTAFTNPLTFVTVPLIVWATFVFGQRGAALSTLLMGGIAIWGTGEGVGPFARSEPAAAFFLLQTYLAITAISAQLFAALLSEHRMTRTQLRALNDGLEQRVRERTRELAELNRQRAAVGALATHDLKGMITALLGYANILRGDRQMSHDELAEVGSYTWELGTRLHDLLDNLYQWSTLQVDKLVHTPQSIDVALLLADMQWLIARQARRKGVNVVLEPCQDCRISADPHMTEAVLRNLVTNAFKFTPSGGTVTLAARPVSGPHGASLVELSVKDNGVGIDPPRLETLFRFDDRSTRPGTQGEKGTGLGLALSKDLVDFLGGTLRIDSTPGRGTICIVTLPRAEG